MLETEYNEEEVLKIVAEAAEKRGEKRGREQAISEFAALLKKMKPDSEEFNRALNASPAELEQLYKKYNIF